MKKTPYKIARDKKLADFKADLDIGILKKLGAEVESESAFTLQLLGRGCVVELCPFRISVVPDAHEPSLTYQILILDYLSARNPRRPSKFVSFADFPEARGYLKPYRGRVLQRLAHGAGDSEKSFLQAARRAGGENAGNAPKRFMFRFFPLFEMQVVRYEADEDFPSSCNMLFSDNALDLLSVESLIVCAEKLVSVMEGEKI